MFICAISLCYKNSPVHFPSQPTVCFSPLFSSRRSLTRSEKFLLFLARVSFLSPVSLPFHYFPPFCSRCYYSFALGRKKKKTDSVSQKDRRILSKWFDNCFSRNREDFEIRLARGNLAARFLFRKFQLEREFEIKRSYEKSAKCTLFKCASANNN